MIVVLLGPDGSGKSTLIARLQQDLSGTFQNVETMHLRPRFFMPKSEGRGPVTAPHAKPPRSRVLSIAKLCYLLLDYSTIIIWKVGNRSKVGQRTILFDRYYHDLLVDPRRYRYGGPMWIARWVGRLIPKPDMWVVLDAAPEVIWSRKKEVPCHETERQRHAYLELARRLDNAHVVDAAQSPGKLAKAVQRLVTDHPKSKTRSR